MSQATNSILVCFFLCCTGTGLDLIFVLTKFSRNFAMLLVNRLFFFFSRNFFFPHFFC